MITMEYHIGNLTNCDLNPSAYKYCSPYTCVTRDTACPCGPYEFTCDNQKCIPDSYLCDSVNNCGDNSDETICTREQTMETISTPVLAGIISGCVVFLVIVIVVTLLYFKWKRRKRKSKGSKQRAINDKENHLHENKALVTSASMEDSNGPQTPKKLDKTADKTEFHTPLKEKTVFHTPKKDSFHLPLDFEEGLLCTSTPKQPLRQLLMTIKSIDDV